MPLFNDPVDFKKIQKQYTDMQKDVQSKAERQFDLLVNKENENLYNIDIDDSFGKVSIGDDDKGSQTPTQPQTPQTPTGGGQQQWMGQGGGAAENGFNDSGTQAVSEMSNAELDAAIERAQSMSGFNDFMTSKKGMALSESATQLGSMALGMNLGPIGTFASGIAHINNMALEDMKIEKALRTVPQHPMFSVHPEAFSGTPVRSQPKDMGTITGDGKYSYTTRDNTRSYDGLRGGQIPEVDPGALPGPVGVSYSAEEIGGWFDGNTSDGGGSRGPGQHGTSDDGEPGGRSPGDGYGADPNGPTDSNVGGLSDKGGLGAGYGGGDNEGNPGTPGTNDGPAPGSAEDNSPHGGTNPGQSGASGGGGGGGGKIVCTAMCNAYGFGGFRQRLWLEWAKDKAPEYEVGYHTIFRPFVGYAYDGDLTVGKKAVRAVLEHIARHRTADIWKQKRGKRDLIGAVERAVLEPLCYVVGKFRKWNGR